LHISTTQPALVFKDSSHHKKMCGNNYTNRILISLCKSTIVSLVIAVASLNANVCCSQ